MTYLERKRFGGKAGSSFIGFVVGMQLMAMLAFFLLPMAVRADDSDILCRGNYACFTSAACAKVGGAFARCPDKCNDDNNQGFCYANQDPVQLKISIGGLNEVVDLGAYIEAVYTYAIGVAGVLAAVMIMIGGIQWMTAGGDKGAAKTRITNALVGLLLTVFAWVFLNTINPSLIRLQMPRVPMVRQEQFVRCDEFKMKVACGQQFGLKEKEGADSGAAVADKYEIVPKDDPDKLADCYGASCSKAGSSDGTHSCQQGDGEPGEQPTTAPEQDLTEPVAPYLCRECVANGQECEGIGPNSLCCGGYCKVTLQGENESIWQRLQNRLANDFGGAIGEFYLAIRDSNGVCGSGIDGERCYVNQDCRSGKCIKDADGQRGGWCSSGRPGSVCDSPADCAGDSSCIDNVCLPKVVGGYCVSDENCPSGTRCRETPTPAARYCYGGSASSGGDISTASCSPGTQGDEQCRDRYGSGYECMESGFGNNEPRCTNGSPGSTCTEDAQCRVNGNNGYCNSDLVPDWTSSGACINYEEGAGCIPGGSSGSGGSGGSGGCSDNGFFCVELAGSTSRGVYMTSGDSGQPCATGICGSRGTCKSGLTCSENGLVCYEE